jgi:cytochrome P450
MMPVEMNRQSCSSPVALKKIPVATRRGLLGDLRAFASAAHLEVAALAGKHGGIAQFRLLHKRLIAVSNPDYAQHMLVGRRERYHRGTENRELRAITGDGLLVTDGHPWLQRRRQMQPSFRASSLQSLVPAVSDTVLRLLDRWERSRRQAHPVPVVADTQSLTISAMVRMLFSHNIDFEEALRLGDAVRNGFRMVGRRQLCRLAPPLWIPTRSNRVLKRHCRVLDSFVRSRVVEHQRKDASRSADIVSTLSESRDPETNAPLSFDALADEVKTLMVAGFETTSSTLAWALYLLARHPEAAARWHEEIDCVLRGRCPGWDDLERLPYTAHVLHETMRLYPPVHTIARDCLEDDDLDGYKIPRGSTVLISVYGIQRGEAWGPDPDAFRPERFTTDWPKRAFLPFATGKHVCIGKQFALIEMMVALALIGQRYRLVLRDNRVVEPKAQVTMVPAEEIFINLTPRTCIQVDNAASHPAAEPQSAPHHRCPRSKLPPNWAPRAS